MTIGDRPATGQAFWSTGTAFGVWRPGEADTVGTLEVLGGELGLDALDVAGRSYRPESPVLTKGTTWQVH